MKRWIWAPFVIAACSKDPAPKRDDRPAHEHEPDRLRVHGLTPPEGVAGDHVGFTGVGFEGRAVEVYFGTARANLVRADQDAIVVEAPEGPSGTRVDVVVIFEPGGEITMNEAFRYR